MTPHKQLYRHDPANGIYGDCGRAVIACLLDRPPWGQVCRISTKRILKQTIRSEWTGDRKRDDWLRHRGLALIRIAIEGDMEISDVLRVVKAPKGVYYSTVRTIKKRYRTCRDMPLRGDSPRHIPWMIPASSGLSPCPACTTWNFWYPLTNPHNLFYPYISV